MQTDSKTQRSEPFSPFAVVVKPTGAACNLDCSYCFFLSKELLYNHARQKMSTQTLEKFIQRYLQAQPDGPVTFLWQGGEPTLRGLDFFRQAVTMAARYARPSQRPQHAIQTNGTLVNQEWAQFFADNNFLVGISLDGPPDLHNIYRVNKAKHPTHAMVLRGWEHLQKAGVDCNILCTIHSGNQDHPMRVYKYFRDTMGGRFIQFIPIVERVETAKLALAEAGWNSPGKEKLLYQQKGHAVTSRSVNPIKYGDFLISVWNLWKTSDIGRIFVQDFDSALGSLLNISPVCVHAPDCGNNFAMEFNGDVYACDHWVEPDWKLGNAHTDNFPKLAKSTKMQQFNRKKRAELPEECENCPVLSLCWGGCPKDRFTGQSGQMNYLCNGYKRFYQKIDQDLRTLATLVTHGQEARAFMELNTQPSKSLKN